MSETRRRRFGSKNDAAKAAIFALALAGIERLGKESPASMIDTFLLHDIADLIKPPEVTRIVVCGGFDNRYRVLNSTEVFYIARDQWYLGPYMPYPIADHGAAFTSDRRLVVAGGFGFVGESAISRAIALPVESTRWKWLPQMPSAHECPGMAAIGDTVFVLGGESRDSWEVFSARTDTWATAAAPRMPTMRTEAGVAAVGHWIFVLGGYHDSHAVATVEALDTKGNTWETFPPMPAACFGMGVAVIDDRFIWTFGGRGGGAIRDSVNVLDTERCEWATPPIAMTSPRYNMGAVAAGHKIVIVGGSGRVVPALNLVEVLDTDTMTWSAARPMPTPRACHATAGF